MDSFRKKLLKAPHPEPLKAETMLRKVSKTDLSSAEYMFVMESIRPIKENPELARELADVLLPFLLQSVEYRTVVETKDKLTVLIENTSRIWEAIAKNSEDIKLLQQEVKLLHEDNKKIWEAIAKNSEDIKLLQQEVKLLHEDNKKIWEAIAKNSEDIKLLQQEVKLLHEDNKKIWEAINDLNTTVRRLEVTVGSFTGRTGVYMERTMLELYREALRLHGIDISKVKSTKLVDEKGIIEKGRRYQIDMIEENGVTYVFEIKNYADDSALEQLALRRKILESVGRKVKLFMVSNLIEEKTKIKAEKEGVTVITGHVLEVEE
jgi:hypothetical protein